ncbi:hypothetical protein Syn7502_02278 [Synechococcus sp. PCC 7502]|uniref:hypothetical protein n=1 Tax=Synechococcus sp. PCC 7502 TaxID=1173263 RepID=UPI00029FEBFD|nr:hypothetical protein [Synechococcus sp. PCC 7502]AFY74283.1 hypothetical protein Syn7502_02278 [Synechococcus sp. PCC 7502]
MLNPKKLPFDVEMDYIKFSKEVDKMSLKQAQAVAKELKLLHLHTLEQVAVIERSYKELLPELIK